MGRGRERERNNGCCCYCCAHYTRAYNKERAFNNERTRGCPGLPPQDRARRDCWHTEQDLGGQHFCSEPATVLLQMLVSVSRAPRSD